MTLPPLLSDLAPLARGVLRDLRAWPERGPRLVDELECVVSVLLAIAFAHALEVRHVGWAAFSAYMVMRSHVWQSFKRGGLRVIGTAAGAAAAWALAPLVLHSLWLTGFALFLIGLATFYLMMVSPRGYAWLFTGLTFAMVLVDGLRHPEEIAAFAQTRFVEVTAGTAACLVVSALSTLLVRRHLRSGFHPGYDWWVDRLIPWHAVAFVHALQGAVALALVPLAWHFLGLEALGQAAITIAVVMAVPLHTLAQNRTRAKLVHRFVGCALGASVATAVLLLAQGSVPVILLAVSLAVVIGRHVENGKHGIDYVGTQFVLAMLVVLVPDNFLAPHLEVGLQRVAGVLLGIALLEPVRWAIRLPATAPASTTSTNEPGRDGGGD
ncbi:FUSC family protein [Niveibacterium sp. SC-1]|uniref:FUSC family protein n=1 Tax=Niveibacterium sp. SC-1 TaxID=3135646 RepID=UPI00311EF1DF